MLTSFCKDSVKDVTFQAKDIKNMRPRIDFLRTALSKPKTGTMVEGQEQHFKHDFLIIIGNFLLFLNVKVLKIAFCEVLMIIFNYKTVFLYMTGCH